MNFGANQNFGVPGGSPSGDDLSHQLGQRLQASELRSAQTYSSMPFQAVPNHSSLEDTLKSIVSHIEVSDQRTAQAFQNIQQQVAQMATHPNINGSARGQQNSSAISSLENRLNNVVSKLEANMAQNSAANTRLEGQVSNLAAQYAQNPGAAYDQESADLHALDSQLQNLGQQHQQMDSRLGDLANRINENVAGNHDPNLDALQNQVQELHQHINSAMPNDMATQNAIEQHLAHISQRLTETENRLNSISTLEANVQDLAGQIGQPAGVSDDMEQQKTALQALNQALGSLRMQAQSSEEKTNETLEAVHDTLEKVISRIASLEQNPPEVIYRGAREDAENTAPPSPARAAAPKVQVPEEFQQPNMAPPPSHAAPVEISPYNNTDTHMGMTADIPMSPAPQARAGAVSNSFIQAARKAAQENIAGKQTKDEKTPQKAPKKEKAEKTGKSKRKPLLIAAAAVLLVIGGLQTYKMTKSGKIKLPVISKFIQKQNATPVVPSSELGSQNKELPKAASTDQQQIEAGPDKPLPAIEAPSTSKSTPSVSKTDAISIDKPSRTDLTTSSAQQVVKASEPVAEPAKTVKTPGSVFTKQQQSSGLTKSAPVRTAAVKTTKPKEISPLPPLGSGFDDLPASIGPKNLRHAAASGDREAQFAIATRYLNGQGVTKDTSKAIIWYQRAAAKGLAPAQYRLGTFYEKGRGVKKDKLTARIWYERAAEQGNRKAMHNLAVIYADANNGKPDFTKAALWFRKASERDLTDSQFNMGILSERGLGVPKDLVEAYKWFSIAGSKGDKDSEARKNAIAKKMDPRSLVLAKLAVDNWSARPLKKSANIVNLNKNNWLASGQQNGKYIQRQMIAEAQSRLNKLGYKAGPPDGIMGKRTRDAIKTYQKKMGLRVTGTASADLIKHLRVKTG